MLAGDVRLATLGTGVDVAALMDVGYSFVPLASDSSLSLMRGGIGLQTRVPLGERFGILAFGDAGGYFGLLSGSSSSSGYGPTFRGGLGVSILLRPPVSLTAGAAYMSYLELYDAVYAFLGTRFGIGGGVATERRRPSRDRRRPEPLETEEPEIGPTEGGVRVEDVELTRVFPVLFKYYDTAPIGTALLANGTEETLEDIEVRVHVERYMDKPKLSASIDKLEPGERREVDLYALFNNRVLDITEGTKVAVEVTCSYVVEEDRKEASATLTLQTYDRNALRWDDDRKVAAFVTAKDEEVQRLAKNMAALSREYSVPAVSRSLQLAIVEFAAMQERGLAYVIDPSSSYAELSQNVSAVDYVPFPRQTLHFQAGDCDDLASTYAAMLESVGVATAFITIPGHILMAFELDLSAAEARNAFTNTEDLIFREDESAWVPVETTMVDRGFLEAWSTGARQWREHSRDDTVGFFRTADAWKVYEPVAFSVSDIELAVPARSAVSRRFRDELERFVSRQIYQQEQQLLARLEERPDDVRTRNRLGILYARYGRFDQARNHFEAIMAMSSYAPALVNLGNIAFLSDRYQSARSYYERALGEDPYSGPALLGMARVAHRLEDYAEADRRYDVLARLDEGLAEQFSYLDPSTGSAQARAGSAAQFRDVVVWGGAQ